MKTITSRAIVILIALSAFATGTTFANNIGVSFLGRPATSLAADEVAGVVPQANWNNINSENPFTGTAASLTDDAGNFTAVSLIFDANDSWNNDGPTVTPNDKLMRGVIKERATVGDSATYTFDGVPAGTYDVYVYTAVNGDDVKTDTTIGATTYYTIEQHQFGGSFIQALNTVNADPSRDTGNYVKFTGVSPLSGTNLALCGTCGRAGSNYYVLASTDVALPLSTWVSIKTNTFDSSGNFCFTNGISPGTPQRFFVIRVP